MIEKIFQDRVDHAHEIRVTAGTTTEGLRRCARDLRVIFNEWRASGQDDEMTQSLQGSGVDEILDVIDLYAETGALIPIYSKENVDVVIGAAFLVNSIVMEYLATRWSNRGYFSIIGEKLPQLACRDSMFTILSVTACLSMTKFTFYQT